MDWQMWFLFTIYLCNAHNVDPNDQFPLHTAVRKGDLNLVVHLLEGGANINGQTGGWWYTPLHEAAYYGRVEIARHLLVKGASKAIKDHEGNTAYALSTWNECDVSKDNALLQICKEASWNYAAITRLLYSAVCNPRCTNGGVCVGYNLCRCNLGWTGNYCQTPVCNPGCTNGKCVGFNICSCNQGWTGTLCQTPSVDRISCTSDLQCQSYQLCDGGDCKDVCSTGTCRKNEVCSVKDFGTFRTSSCRCPDGFFVDTDNICKKSGCIHDSECEDNKLCNSGTCIDPCDLGICGEGARCRSQGKRPQCFCPVLTQGDPYVLCQPTQITEVPNENDDIGCPVPTEIDSKVSIIKCGKGKISKCINNNKVPVGTDVMVSCWRSPPIIVRCTNDHSLTSWGVCDDSQNCEMPLTVLEHLCQQEAPNAQYCGYRPPYSHVSSAAQHYPSNNIVQEWPWLVGIYVKENYVCTGTLISIRFVLSAAHCTSKSKSSNEPINYLDVKLQHVGDGIEKSRIDKIIHHRDFRNGPRPKNDISLLRLQKAVTFSKSVMPACIANQLPVQPESAVAFDRNEGETNFEWRTQLQKLDNRCQTSGEENYCQLKIENRQFCSRQLFPGQSSVIKQGSSGGPYLVNMGTEEHEVQSVVGVVSYRVELPSCNGNEPFTVYTDITAFSYWIELCLDTPLDSKEDCHGGYTGYGR